jgi:hypothetical protein
MLSCFSIEKCGTWNVLEEVPAGPDKKQSAGRIETACSRSSPLPLCELTPEDWQLALTAPVIHLDRHDPTMPVLGDVGFEPPPPSDQGVPQSGGPAVSMLLLGWCSPEHDGCDLHLIKHMIIIGTGVRVTALSHATSTWTADVLPIW